LDAGYGGSTTALDALAGRIAAAGGSGFQATVVRLAGDLQLQANVLNCLLTGDKYDI
jgi:hypothetical protein